LFSAFYSDRGSHYWTTPEAGGKVDKSNLTQFGRALKQLGIDMIVAYSPQARGRSERAFATHQGRLPKELALAGITTMDAANRYLKDVYRPAFNAEFAQPPLEDGTAFVPFLGGSLDDILCEQFERTVGKDNCVRFEGLTLQIPRDRHPAVTTSKPTSTCIATRTVRWRFFTVHGSLRNMMGGGHINNNPSRPPRNSVSRRIKKRTFHLLQNRTFLFVANNISANEFYTY
jgi:hypothetical protein